MKRVKNELVLFPKVEYTNEIDRTKIIDGRDHLGGMQKQIV